MPSKKILFAFPLGDSRCLSLIGDVPQPCATTHWQTEFPGPEGDSEESKGQPDEPVDFKPPHWDIGTEEVVTLGLSGEYLYPVKTEPHLLSSLGVMEGARDSSSCSPKHFSGECLALSVKSIRC